MCSIAGAGLIIGILSAAGTAVQQNQQQSRTVKYQNRVTQVTQDNAAKAANVDYIAAAEQAAQVRQAAAQENFAASRQSQQAQGTLAVGAERAGLEGGSINDIRLTIAQRAAEDAAVRATNLNWEEAQIQRSIQRIGVDQQNRANSRYGPAIPGVDYASLLGNLAGAVFNYSATPSKKK